jgi:hypothetical protein
MIEKRSYLRIFLERIGKFVCVTSVNALIEDRSKVFQMKLVRRFIVQQREGLKLLEHSVLLV